MRKRAWREIRSFDRFPPGLRDTLRSIVQPSVRIGIGSGVPCNQFYNKQPRLSLRYHYKNAIMRVLSLCFDATYGQHLWATKYSRIGMRYFVEIRFSNSYCFVTFRMVFIADILHLIFKRKVPVVLWIWTARIMHVLVISVSRGQARKQGTAHHDNVLFANGCGARRPRKKAVKNASSWCTLRAPTGDIWRNTLRPVHTNSVLKSLFRTNCVPDFLNEHTNCVSK